MIHYILTSILPIAGLFAALNFILYLAHNRITGKPLRYLYAVILKRIFRREPEKEKYYYGAELAEMSEKRDLILTARYLIINLILVEALMTLTFFHEHPIFYFVALVLPVVLFFMGRAREIIFVDIEERFKGPKAKEVKSDVEKRNIMLAQALIELEKEVLRLKKADKNVKRDQARMHSKGYKINFG